MCTVTAQRSDRTAFSVSLQELLEIIDGKINSHSVLIALVQILLQYSYPVSSHFLSR